MSNASFELPNTEVVVIDGYRIDLSAGAAGGQTLIYNAGTNTFTAGTASGTVSGSFVAQQVAYGTGTYTLTGSSNFIFDDGYNVLRVFGDGYVSQRMIINGSTAAVSSSGTGAFRFNSGSNHLEFSENGGSWTTFGTSLAIGGSVSGGTNKSILFINSGALAQDNANFNYDNSTHKLTISGHVSVDGYTIDLSAGATSTQVLAFNGTSFVATNQSGGIAGTLTSTKVPYATGTSTLADSGMVWDNTNKILTVTTLAGNDGVAVTDGTRSLGLFVNYNSAAVGALGTTSNHNLVFFTNNSSAQVILSTGGQLGIGSSPSYALHVVGDGYVTSRSIINASSAAVSPSGTGAFRFNTGTNHLEFSENAGSWTQLGSGSGMAIGGAITSGTAHSILYVDGSGNLAQDNANLYYDYTNKLLGIGKTPTNPFALDVNGFGRFFVAGNASDVIYLKNTSTSGWTAVNASDSGGTIQTAFGYGNSSTSDSNRNSKAFIWTNSSQDFVITNQSTGLLATFPSGGGLKIANVNTSGSLVYVNSSNALAQDNSNLFWDASNHRLGIGNASPSFALDVTGVGRFTSHIRVDGYTIDLSAGGTNGQALVYDTGTGTVHFSTVSGGGGSSIGTSGQKFITHITAGFSANNGTSTVQTVGGCSFTPTSYALSGTTQSVEFRAIAACGNGTVTGHVKLRDVTNGVDIVTLNITGTSDTTYTQALTISSAGSNTISSSAAIYEVRIYVDSPVQGTDFIQLYLAELRNINTIN